MRAGHRASATRLMAQAEAALAADPLSMSDVQLSVTNLRRKGEILTPLDAEILELTPDEAIETEIEHADQYQENIQATISKIHNVLSPPGMPTPRTDATPEVLATHTSITSATPRAPTPTEPGGSAHGSKVKLPKLTLPHFNGNPLKWTMFWDSYDSAIHSNEELNDVDKFNYLRSLLEGSALEAVRGLTLQSILHEKKVKML